MISNSVFLTRTRTVYNSMVARFKPKLWKSGKRAGLVRDPGHTVPFSLDEYREWAMAKVGLSVALCVYCRAPIDIMNYSTDHAVPMKRGGSLGLDNLAACCADCNNGKGGLTGTEFMRLIDFLRMLDPRASKDIMGRLRSGAMGARMRFFPRDKEKRKVEAAAPSRPSMDEGDYDTGF